MQDIHGRLKKGKQAKQQRKKGSQVQKRNKCQNIVTIDITGMSHIIRHTNISQTLYISYQTETIHILRNPLRTFESKKDKGILAHQGTQSHRQKRHLVN